MFTMFTNVNEDDHRAVLPLVYRDPGTEDGWLVEPPDASAGASCQAFTGPNARLAALEFAHRTYGCARYLASN
jgi:hypothetical protein